MGFDRNTITGFILLGVLFMGYFWYTSNSAAKANAIATEQQRVKDSTDKANHPNNYDTAKQKSDSVHLQHAQETQSLANFSDSSAKETFTIVENNVMRATFSSKGGWMKQIELKKYRGVDSQLVKMGGTDADHFGYNINTGNGQSSNTDKLIFNPGVASKSPDGTQIVSFQKVSKDGKSIAHVFTIRPDDYMIDARIDLNGADQMLVGQNLNITWGVKARQQQKNITYERLQAKLVARTGGDFDYWTAARGTTQQLDKPTQWVGLKQQFFNSTIVAKNNFNSVNSTITVPAETDTSLGNEAATMLTTAHILMPAGSHDTLAMQLYYGPNEYNTLKAYNNDMINIVDLGSGAYAFVKYINRWLIMPVFGFFAMLVGGKMGWAILLLTLFIRLIISPITYKAYLSGAKMKVMQPELKTLKAKFGTDQQGYSMAQMKLFREAGINPLGGCIPMLAQLPIFFALFAFFNSNIGIRSQPFLWAKDLSMYDTIFHFGTKIPLIGDHISLFTITACISSFFISLYSMGSTPTDQNNPMMKYMPYIFPFMMLFFFNNQPAALTWYYTVSNLVTLLIQVIIQKYIINHDKILADIAVKRTQPKAKSKLQERLEAMQNSQKNIQDLKNKTGKK